MAYARPGSSARCSPRAESARSTRTRSWTRATAGGPQAARNEDQVPAAPTEGFPARAAGRLRHRHPLGRGDPFGGTVDIFAATQPLRHRSQRGAPFSSFAGGPARRLRHHPRRLSSANRYSLPRAGSARRRRSVSYEVEHGLSIVGIFILTARSASGRSWRSRPSRFRSARSTSPTGSSSRCRWRSSSTSSRGRRDQPPALDLPEAGDRAGPDSHE